MWRLKPLSWSFSDTAEAAVAVLLIAAVASLLFV